MKHGEEKKFVPSREAVQFTGINHWTLRKWADQGQIQSYKTPSGKRMYSQQGLLKLTHSLPATQEAKKIIYCRVSSKKQLPDLERQIASLRSSFPNYLLVSDIASGVNFKRKGLQTILELAMQKQLAEVVVSHKDKLCRFGFELMQNIFELANAKLTVFDTNDSTNIPSTEQELAEDLLSIVHIYSCKQMGKRRYRVQNSSNSVLSNRNSENGVVQVDAHD